MAFEATLKIHNKSNFGSKLKNGEFSLRKIWPNACTVVQDLLSNFGTIFNNS